MTKEIIDSPDSEALSWKRADLEIGYDSGALTSVSPAEIERSGCTVMTESGMRGVVLIERDRLLVSMFSDDYHKPGYHAISVRSPSKDRQLQVLRILLRSTRFVNRIENLRIDQIARDLKSFRYLNEIGDLRTGKVGDIITRDYGRVDRIAPDAVNVTEVVPDGTGGYAEERRVLRIEPNKTPLP